VRAVLFAAEEAVQALGPEHPAQVLFMRARDAASGGTGPPDTTVLDYSASTTGPKLFSSMSDPNMNRTRTPAADARSDVSEVSLLGKEEVMIDSNSAPLADLLLSSGAAMKHPERRRPDTTPRRRRKREASAPVTGVEVAKPPPNPNNQEVLLKELRMKSKAFHAELAAKGETLRDVRQEVIAGMGRQQANQRRADMLPAAPPVSNKRSSMSYGG
jgi:hypothetical protein